MGKEANRVEILLEEIRGDVKLALEGYDVLKSEMRQMEGRLTERIQSLEVNQNLLSKKQDSLSKGQDSLSKKLEAVHASLKNEIRVTGLAINDRLDEHIRQPSRA